MQENKFKRMNYRKKISLRQFKNLFEQFVRYPDIAEMLSQSTNPMAQKAIIADTIIFLMKWENCKKEELVTFTHGRAYFEVGIPKEFLR